MALLVLSSSKSLWKTGRAVHIGIVKFLVQCTLHEIGTSLKTFTCWNQSLCSSYKKCFTGTLLQHCKHLIVQMWVLGCRPISRLQAAEFKYLKCVVNKMDRVRNDQNRDELEIESIRHTPKENKLKDFMHLVKMNEEMLKECVW